MNPNPNLMHLPTAYNEATELRLKYLENGWRVLPTAAKRAFLRGWPQMSVTPDIVRSWPMTGPNMAPAVTTAIQLVGCTMVIDSDVENWEIAERIEDLMFDVFGDEVMANAPKRDSGGAKFMVMLRTEAPFAIWKTPAFVDQEGNSQRIECFGGGSTRYFSTDGPHTLATNQDGSYRIVDGQYEVFRAYRWCQGPTPFDLRPEDLPLVTDKQLLHFQGAVSDLLAAAPGWTKVEATKSGHFTERTFYDLTEDMKFDVGGGMELTYEEALGYAMSEYNPRCTSSFIDGKGVNASKCQMHVGGNANDSFLWVFDYESYTMHLPEDRARPTAEESARKVSDLGSKMRELLPSQTEEQELLTWLEKNLAMSRAQNGELYITPNASNGVMLMKVLPAWRDVFAYDLFRQEGFLTEPIPGSMEDNGAPFPGRHLKETDFIAALLWFQRNAYKGWTLAAVEQSVKLVLHESQTDILLQAIEDAAAAWDGVSRIDRLFSDYFIATDDNAYTRELGCISMMALVQRALYPGAFQKMVPILEGPQDLGKSRGVRALCPDPDWFADNIPSNLNDKDAAIALRGKFLIELAELASTSRAEQNAVKSFVTRQVEKFRPPYGKVEVSEPRRCMCWGTVNEDNYLRDATGSARFFPVVLKDVDVSRIAEDREQLLGEAAVRLQEAVEAGDDWWRFSGGAMAILNGARREKGEEDPWTGVVLNYVEERDEVTPREILTAVRIPGGCEPACKIDPCIGVIGVQK